MTTRIWDEEWPDEEYGDSGHELGHAQIVHETEKAVLVYVDELGDEVWVPRSQIHPETDFEIELDAEGDLVVSSWLANERGWM